MSWVKVNTSLEKCVVPGGTIYRTWIDGTHESAVAMVFVPNLS